MTISSQGAMSNISFILSDNPLFSIEIYCKKCYVNTFWQWFGNLVQFRTSAVVEILCWPPVQLWETSEWFVLYFWGGYWRQTPSQLRPPHMHLYALHCTTQTHIYYTTHITHTPHHHCLSCLLFCVIICPHLSSCTFCTLCDLSPLWQDQGFRSY